MPRRKIGPQFDMGDVTILADGRPVYSVYVNGKAPLNGGGAAGVPLGLLLGRVWEQPGYGWVAAAPRSDGQADSWHDEINRSHRHFARRKDACLFLYGWRMALGRQRFEAAMAEMPWVKHSEKAVAQWRARQIAEGGCVCGTCPECAASGAPEGIGRV